MAAGARIRPITGVTPEMHHQCGALGESFLTVRALVRPFTRVRAPVHAQIILRDEPLAAKIAHVRLFAGVLTQMDGQVSFTGHSLAAHRANVFVRRSHVPVGFHVHQQHLLPREAFVTELAMVLPLRRHVVRLMELRV